MQLGILMLRLLTVGLENILTGELRVMILFCLSITMALVHCVICLTLRLITTMAMLLVPSRPMTLKTLLSFTGLSRAAYLLSIKTCGLTTKADLKVICRIRLFDSLSGPPLRTRLTCTNPVIVLMWLTTRVSGILRPFNLQVSLLVMALVAQDSRPNGPRNIRLTAPDNLVTAELVILALLTRTRLVSVFMKQRGTRLMSVPYNADPFVLPVLTTAKKSFLLIRKLMRPMV